MRLTRATLLLSLCAPVCSQNNLLQNGDFELGPTIPGGQTEVTIFGNEVPGWSVALGNCDFNSAFWTPSSGQHSIDLHGTERGAIQQTFLTQSGATYLMMFDLGASGTQACYVSAAGQTSPTFTHTGGTFPQVTYALDQTWSFVANAAITTLRFDSASGGNSAGGAHIDHVRVFRAAATASFRSFGSGCPGSAGTPSLSAFGGSRPLLGQQFDAELLNLSGSLADAAFLLIGLESANPPTPLDAIGMEGCNLLIVPVDAWPLLKTGSTARWRPTIPNDLGLLGASIFVQEFGFDRNPAPNLLGATTSNAAELVLGNQ